MLNTAVFIKILRRRKRNPTVSLSTAQKIQCFKVLSGKDPLSHFLKEFCLHLFSRRAASVRKWV